MVPTVLHRNRTTTMTVIVNAMMTSCTACKYTRRYDLSWFQKLRGIQFKDGKLRLGKLTGGKQDDITVLVSVVEGRGSLFDNVSDC